MIPMAPSVVVVILGAVTLVPSATVALVDAEGVMSQTEVVSTPENTRSTTDQGSDLPKFQE
jgi:hypothetical protein